MPATFVNIQTLGVDGTPLTSESASLHRVQRSVTRVLTDNVLCAWATVSPDGQAHVNTGYFAYSDLLHFYLLSHPRSLHCRNLAANPSMAVAVFASGQKWTDPGRGLQLFGTCAPVDDDGMPDAEHIYGGRFSQYAAWRGTLKAGDPAQDYRLYRFVPDRVKVLDEGEFGDAVWVQADIVPER